MPRKEKKFHFIYKTTNLLSGKYYIGMHSTDNLEDGYLGSGKRLRRSINKYGADNHKREILEFVDSRNELKEREREIINLNEIAKEDCMNLKVGGEGGFIDENHAKKWHEGQSKWLKEQWNNDNYRKKISLLSSERMKQHHKDGKIKYDTFTGKEHSEETKNKMSESSKGMGIGKSNSQFGTCWITKNDVNKKIKKEELEVFVNLGWIKGRKMN
jgi:hypothetical protein